MVKRLSCVVCAAALLCVTNVSAATALSEKHYRQAAWAFYLQQPEQALESLQLAPQQDQRTQLLEAGLYLQLAMPQHAATVLQALVDADSKQALEQALLNVALLQFARHQLELGDKATARQYLSRVKTDRDQTWLGSQQLLSQLVDWPQISLPESPQLDALRQQAEMPYIVSNQILLLAQQQPKKALGWLSVLQQQLQPPRQQNFWQLLFSGQWTRLATPDGFVYRVDEYQALADYLQLLQAQLHIRDNDFAAADAILSNFPADSVLSTAALGLYSEILTEQRHIPTLLAVLQQQIRLQPFSITAWQAATSIGAQLERALQQKDALAAYRWAEQYYQQQQQLIEQQAVPLQVDQLEQGLADWQQLQLSENDALHRLQQDILALQQQLLAAPQRQQRLAELSQVTSYKLSQQTALLSHQLPLLQQRRDALLQRVQQLKQQLTAAQSAPMSLLLLDGEAYQQLNTLQAAQRRLDHIISQHSTFKAADYQQRLSRLHGILQWQYYDSKPERQLAVSRAVAALNTELEQMDVKLVALSQQSEQSARLGQIQQRLAQLGSKQQQLNLALLGQQQQLLAQLNQQLQQKRQQDLSTLTALQRHNKEAMARVMERVLMMADSVNAGVGHD